MKKHLKMLQFPLAFLLYIFYLLEDVECKNLVNEDVKEMNRRMHVNHGLIYWLVYGKPYRNLFYVRVRYSHFLSIFLPKYPLFEINYIEGIGGAAFVLNHPYATIINARRIGSNFTCCQCTTIGNKRHGHNELVPTIGNNVSLGANVTIIGDIKIGDNVIIGAGSVVVKDVPSDVIIGGNPSQIIGSTKIVK